MALVSGFFSSWFKSIQLNSYYLTVDKVSVRMDMHKFAGNRGASLVEYALLVALIALIGVAAVSMTGQSSARQFNCVADQMGANTDCPDGGEDPPPPPPPPPPPRPS